MLPWVRQAFQPAPLLVSDDVIWSTRGMHQGKTLGPFLFAVGIQAALEALPPGGALQRWYLDDGVFMGSVAGVKGVLKALRHTLPYWASSSTYVKRPCGSWAWCLRRSRSRQRRACTSKGAGRRWGCQSTHPFIHRRWGPPGWPEGQVRAHVRGRGGPG